jgi:predicted naringenin-chalcone synthase
LQRYGNVSSATVFFIMDALREVAPPREGALGLMLALGPGLSCEMVLLRAAGWLCRPGPSH